MMASRKSWLASSVMAGRGSMPSASRAMSGLKMVTATHMLRKVLGNTPGACSSTKLAEDSKPEMPSRPAEKPKNSARATPRPPGRGACQLAAKMSGCCIQ